MSGGQKKAKKAQTHSYHVIKYDAEDGGEVSAIISSAWFENSGGAVKKVRIPKDRADNGQFLITHKKPLLKASEVIDGYDIIQNFDDLERAKIFFRKMQQDEDDEAKDFYMETSSDEEIKPPSPKKVKTDYDFLLLKAQEKMKSVPAKKNSLKERKPDPSNLMDSERYSGNDDHIVTVADLKIFEKKILSHLKTSENKIHSEIHDILSNVSKFASKYHEEIENLSANADKSVNVRATQKNDQFPFPLKTWDDMNRFCENIENDENFRESKVRQMEIYAAMGSSIDEKKLKRTFRNFLKALTTPELRVQGNFAGRTGTGKQTNKVPEAFMAFIKECFRGNNVISSVSIEENIKKAWNQTGDTLRKMKKRDAGSPEKE